MKTLSKEFLAALLCTSALVACNGPGTGGGDTAAAESPCQFVDTGWGPAGTVPIRADKVVTGLEAPWSVAFLPNGDWLVTERPGRIRLVRSGGSGSSPGSGGLAPAPVTTVSIGETGEGGLLGLALHPAFASNRFFYVFYTTDKNGATVNRVQRFVLSADHASATPDKVILDDIPAGTFHDGGRIKFGPDGLLYVATGDARNPDNARDPRSLNGKLLRVDAEGGIPSGNPLPGSPVFVLGIRNLEAFDWVNPNLLVLADNGPTGELGLTGLDKVSFASAGADLGWPAITGCQTQSGLVNPILSWATPAPPGGGIIYHGNAIPEFNGSFLIGMLGIGDGTAMQLHRVVFDAGSQTLVAHESYLQGQFGRLRDVTQGPDGALYVTTSNCDTRGTCPADKDYILRVTRN